MSCILCIETSANICSAVLAIDGEIVYNKMSQEEKPSHAALLGTFVDGALKEAVRLGVVLDGVAVSSGPGSYTGLRIGVSLAKGICFGYNIPLISLSTLEVLAHKMICSGQQSDLYCPMIDARRMEVYAAIYDKNGAIQKDVEALIIDADSFADVLASRTISFFGDGAEKCREVITNPNANFIDGVRVLATDMAGLAEEAYAAKRFVDTAYFEPFYLKDFVATVAKNKVLGNKGV